MIGPPLSLHDGDSKAKPTGNVKANESLGVITKVGVFVMFIARLVNSEQTNEP